MERGLIQSISERLETSEPPLGELRLASVAIILRGEESPSVLLIRRAERSGDPWSGQIAFPGGKTSPEDKTARGTAARETREEVGIDLGTEGEFLGYGPKVQTHTGAMEVYPAVFTLKHDVAVTPNAEVASYRWVRLSDLLSPLSASSYKIDYGGREVEMPSYAVDDYVVWGLTYRIISTIFGPGAG